MSHFQGYGKPSVFTFEKTWWADREQEVGNIYDHLMSPRLVRARCEPKSPGITNNQNLKDKAMELLYQKKIHQLRGELSLASYSRPYLQQKCAFIIIHPSTVVLDSLAKILWLEICAFLRKCT